MYITLTVIDSSWLLLTLLLIKTTTLTTVVNQVTVLVVGLLLNDAVTQRNELCCYKHKFKRKQAYPHLHTTAWEAETECVCYINIYGEKREEAMILHLW